ncbi:MAG: 4Fe-4S dicluster domain-containing protein [Deltaproteobacteria bacterium]|nr:4Fe-4S dicluster domain-containing protein [Deltaproteobacteria bacterium]
MEKLTEKIREIAKRLLSDGKVDVVIGYRAGTIPLKNIPYFARTPEEIDNLIWDSNGRVNLANFLPRRTDRAAVVAKGCDARNIVNHIVENQIKRDQVYIIGVPCEGMIDPELVYEREERLIEEAIEADGKLTVKGRDFETTIARDEILRQNCRVCTHRNPAVYDEMVAEAVPEQEGVDPYEDIKDLLTKSDSERAAYFEALIEPCIRCYACRDACPLCYCSVCFVDESMPQWLGKSIDENDKMTFHILRAFHCAGRCTDCGACEAACPMNIKVSEAGLSTDNQPPLTVYRPDDSEEFIK